MFQQTQVPCLYDMFSSLFSIHRVITDLDLKYFEYLKNDK